MLIDSPVRQGESLAIKNGRQWVAIILLSGTLAATAKGQIPLVLERPSGDVESGMYGDAVAVDGSMVMVGAPRAARGVVYVYQRTGLAWERIQTLEGVEPNGQFGSCVSVDGDTAIVGAIGWTSATIPNGALYVFRWTGSAWVLETRLIPDDLTRTARFGMNCVVEADRIVVGVPVQNNGPGQPPAVVRRTGVVYVFERDDAGSWEKTARLDSPISDSGLWFGIDVSLSGDHLLVGADPPGAKPGAAWLYEHSGGDWVEVAHIEPPLSDGGRRGFGQAVGIAGHHVLVANPGSVTGTVYHYGLEDGAVAFIDTLRSPGLTSGAEFGYDLSISARAGAGPKQAMKDPGEFDVVVGAPLGFVDPSRPGRIDVFRIRGQHTQKHLRTVTNTGPGLLGASVAANDGWVVAGAPASQGPNVIGNAFMIDIQSLATGAEPQTILDSWSIFPLPVGRTFTIATSSAARWTRLELFDVTGRRLWTSSLVAGVPTRFELNQRPAGMYFVRVSGPRGSDVRPLPVVN